MMVRSRLGGPDSHHDDGRTRVGRAKHARNRSSQRCDSGRMTAWKDVERAEPEFAPRVQELFDGHRHKTIATVRADGSPRISGIEAVFEDGELVFGSMPNARRGADLHRDPRFALTPPPSTRSKARRRNGRARRRSPGGRSLRSRSPRDPKGALLRRHRRGRPHSPGREGHDARRRVVDADHGLRRIERTWSSTCRPAPGA